MKLDRAQQTARVESATALPADLQAQRPGRLDAPVRAGAEHFLRPEPGADRGMRIRVGSDVYDGSVQAGWLRLEQEILNQPEAN